MVRGYLFLGLFLATSPLSAQPSPHIASTPPLSPEEQLKKFHLPPGFAIELVAAEPKVKKPINIAFDAWGNLYVTESVEYPFAAKEGQGKDTVKVLSDFAADGLARKVETFAAGLNIPIGVLPLYKMDKDLGKDGKTTFERPALVFSIPNLWWIGGAEHKEALFTGYGFQDTHGMTGEFTWGLDGWVYCCHGFANSSKVKGADTGTLAMQSGNTYRIKPDGSKLEQYTWGQVNPFGLSIDPLGNVYSADCHTRPLYQLIKGAYYPSFGKPHDGLGYGPEMVTHDHGSTAIAGVAYYDADQYPKEFRDNLFIGNVVTNRINRDRIEWHGSSPKGIAMPDLVKCDDPWFRPVDIKLGPDGCLYVADFYNRIIGHYEVPLNHPGRDREKGRIWRIVYRGENQQNRPRPALPLPDAKVDEVIAELGSPNIAVRVQATNVLANWCAANAQTAAKVQEVAKTGKGAHKAHAMWVLERCGKLPEQSLAGACTAGDRVAHVHALKILGGRSELSPLGREFLLAGLADGDPFVQRAAAEALSDHPAPEHLGPLLQLRRKVPPSDSHLLHTVRIALRNQMKDEKVAGKGKRDWNDGEHRAVADVLPGVKASHAAALLKEYLPQREETAANFQKYAHHLVRYGMAEDGPWVLDLARTRYAGNLGFQAGLLKTVLQAKQERGETIGAKERTWAENLVGQCLQTQDKNLVLTSLDLAGMLALSGAAKDVLALAKDSRQAEDVRKGAVVALVRIDLRGHLKELLTLLANDQDSITLREQVAGALAATNDPPTHAALLATLETAPGRLQNGIALALAGSVQGGDLLLDAISAGKASRRLLQEQAIVQRLQQSKLPKVAERVATLTQGLPTADVQLAKKMSQRRSEFLQNPGMLEHGFKVFEKNCAACHQIANKGAKFGPQLDGIGMRGLDRLLEDILDPSRNVDQAFRATLLELKNGQVVNGLFLREEGEIFVLADAQGKEARVAKKTVQERSVTALSPMPANLIDTLSASDINNLLAYLLAQRVKE